MFNKQQQQPTGMPAQTAGNNIMAQIQQMAQQLQKTGMTPEQYAKQMIQQNGGNGIDEAKIQQFVGFAKQFGITDAQIQQMISSFRGGK